MEHPAGRKVIVFMLEDDPTIAALVQDAVEMQGWQLVHSTTCKEALATLQKGRPDVALLDVNLPDGEGYSVCEALRRVPEFATLPVVFLTSRGDVTSRLKGFSAGAQDYVTKPFLIQELVARVQAHLAIKDRETALSQELLKTKLHERVRQDIMDMVVHDLSAPLSTVKMTLDMINTRGLVTDPSYVRYLKSAENSLEFALVMIAGLLDLGAGTVRVDAQQVDYAALVQRLQRMFGPQFEVRKAALEFAVPASPFKLVSDQTLLFRILANLLSNALKFSPSGGRVVIRPTSVGTGLRVEVIDQGLGIPPEEKEAIFKKYHRATAGSIPGSGIGLAFCRMACDALNGRIWVEDSPPRGSRFIVELPSLS
ncbi:MAG: hybrid sensor histidine kinase/response regulator [Elusimicrobiota bacterium]|jgi:two-component system sensor histidine kinase/response regulator